MCHFLISYSLVCPLNMCVSFSGMIQGDKGNIKKLVFGFPSDLMKSTVVDESLSSNKTNVLSQRISAYFNKIR